MNTSLPDNTNTITQPAAPLSIDKKDEQHAGTFLPTDIRKIVSRISAYLSTLRDVNKDLYCHNPEKSQKDIVQIGADAHTRAKAYELIDYVGIKTEADVELLKKFMPQFVDKNLVTIPYDVLDIALERIQKSRGGISCINKILEESNNVDLPEEFHHLYNDFSKGALYGAMEMLAEMSADQEEELHEILCKYGREIS